MNSDEDDLNDLFDDRVSDDNENNDQEQQAVISNEGGNADTGFTPVTAPKRKIKNPRLKFDADRLCGPRGIPIIVDHFKGVKFKGKGHEIEDLDRLLSTLELWTHRLYPSMKFEDTLKQIEKLGKKKPVQVCVQKIRMDMPILNSDFVGQEEDDVLREGDSVIPPASTFDALLEDHQRSTQEHTDVPVTTATRSSLTEEQLLKMQRNKALAEERRKARLLAHQQDSEIMEALASTSNAYHSEEEEDYDVDDLMPDGWHHETHTTPKVTNNSDNFNDSHIDKVLQEKQDLNIAESVSQKLKTSKIQRILSDDDDDDDVELSTVPNMEDGNRIMESSMKNGNPSVSYEKSVKKLRILSDSDDNDDLMPNSWLNESLTIPKAAHSSDNLNDINSDKVSQEKRDFPKSNLHDKLKTSKIQRILSDDDDDVELSTEPNMEDGNQIMESPLKNGVPYEKPAKKLRILSDSDDNDDLMPNSWLHNSLTIPKAAHSSDNLNDIHSDKISQEKRELDLHEKLKTSKTQQILSDDDDGDVELSNEPNVNRNPESSPENISFGKPAKRPRILSDSDDNCDIDDLVEGSFPDD